MSIIRFSVNHPVTTCMLMLAFAMGGAFSFSRMEVELLPSISIPTLVIATDLPKASPEKVHREVTLPMEETLNSVSDLVSLNSISFEGKSQLIMEFDWGCDVRMAEIEVREKVNALKLPDAASKPLIKRFDPSSAPVFRFDILGSELSTSDLRLLAEDAIKPRLERLSGVGEVEIVGGTDPEFRVIGDREKLSENDLTILSLVQCIEEESRNQKGGTLEIEGGMEASLRILGKAASITDLENLIVATTADGITLRVSDLATVVRTNKETESYARIDGASSVGLAVKKSSDASVVTVVQQIRMELDDLIPQLTTAGASFQVSQDDSEYVVNSQTLVLNSIMQGVTLAGIFLLLFLRDIRATIIVSIATPISMASAAIMLNAFDISRNVLTLGGLGLAAGMTLDTSIVLIESIYKQLRMGLNPKEAAIRGASEVAMGIFSSTMTTVAVFLPILFIPGLMQEIFKSLAHAIIWAMLSSMVVGILLIPMISARILSNAKPDPSRQSKGMRIATYPWNQVCRGMDWFDKTSEGILGGILSPLLRQFAVKGAILLVLLCASIGALIFLPGKGFLPQGQVDELWVRFEAPAGSTLAYVDDRTRLVEDLLAREPYRSFVKSVSADVRDDEGKLFVRLYPNRKLAKRNEKGEKIEGWETMRPPEWHSLSECIQQIRDGCDGIPDLAGNTFVTVVDKVKGGTAAPIILKVFSRESGSADSEKEQLLALQAVAQEKLVPVIKTIPSAVYQRVKINETPMEILISTEQDRRLLSERGLSTQQISDTVRASVYGVTAATVFEGNRETDVTVLLEDGVEEDSTAKFGLDSISSLRVRSPSTGATHPLGEVAAVSEAPSQGSRILERFNRKPTVDIESHYAPYEVTGETIGDVNAQIAASLSAIPGFDQLLDYQVKSSAKDTAESFRDATYAFLISIVLVYMIMCSQFEKFLDPLAIMVTVPLAAAGSVVMLNLTGEITSLAALVGAVILCGVVVNNGIILVEYINILRKRGVEKSEAVVEGSLRKLKSILITSLTSILGMLPMVLGVGEGTELYRGTTAVIVGGLLVSTPLTLIALPLLYSFQDEATDWFGALGFRLKMQTSNLAGKLFSRKLS